MALVLQPHFSSPKAVIASEAKQSVMIDCFVATLLAMTTLKKESVAVELVFVVGERFGKLCFDFLDSGLVRGMVGQERGRRLALHFFGHALPKSDAAAGIVACLGHEDQPDMVRLGLLLAAER